MMNRGFCVLVATMLITNVSCKTADDGSQENQLASHSDDAAVAPTAADGRQTEPQRTVLHLKCAGWENKVQEAFALDASGTDENATLQTKSSLLTGAGQIPVGTYQLVEGSPGDGSCLEYYADISSTIKPVNSESSGLIVSNCDVTDESEWRIKAYVRRTDGHDAEIVYDERYSCSLK